MQNNKNWEEFSNFDEESKTDKKRVINEEHHRINMLAREFGKECENAGIPVFVSYYLPGKGYKYRAVFPEEIGTDAVRSEYGKFIEFLRICIDFDKNDYFPNVDTENKSN